MTRVPKAPLSSHMVPIWALNGASRPRGRIAAEKVAPGEGGLLRVDEASSHLNVCEKTIRRLIKAGALKAIRIGRLVRIERREIERFLTAVSHPDNGASSTTRGGHDE